MTKENTQPVKYEIPAEILQGIVNVLSMTQQHAIDALSNSRALLVQIQTLTPVVPVPAVLTTTASMSGTKPGKG